MSNVEAQPVEQTIGPGPMTSADEPEIEYLKPREVPLGGPRAMLVQRTLPNRDRRMVGAWCFVDSYGPSDIRHQAGMRVPPHPHTGLQTVSWLLSGEIWHADSLGSQQLIRPGQLNLMTAGAGIAHSEESPEPHSGTLHGVQLWVAQPDSDRAGPASFEHHADLPTTSDASGSATVLVGELAGQRSAATTFTPLMGAELAIFTGQRLELDLEPEFEHAILALDHALTVDGHGLTHDAMLYLSPGRQRVRLEAGGDTPVRALLIGGTPFPEPLVMWWNFVGRTHEEIVEARRAWEQERSAIAADGTERPARFGHVPSTTPVSREWSALPAPELPNARLRARPRYQQHKR